MYRSFSFLLVCSMLVGVSCEIECSHAGKAKCFTPHSQWTDEDKMHEQDCIALLREILVVNSTHVRSLIEQGAPINYALMRNGNTPIYYAAADAKIEKLRILLDYGADPTIPNNKGVTPLHVASYNGHENVVKTLLSHRLYVKGKNEASLVALKDGKGNTPLHLAVARCHTEVARLLLSHNAPVNEKNKYLSTPLHAAVECDNEELVELLLSHHAQAESRDAEYDTALDIAVLGNNVQIVKMLLSKLPKKDKDVLEKPLRLACDMGNPEIIKELLDSGADPNHVTPHNYFHRKLVKARVQALLRLPESVNFRQLGAQEYYHRKLAKSLLDYAALMGQEAVVKELVNAGAIVQNSTSKSEPLFCRVMGSGYETIAHHLIAAGVKPHQARGCENQFEKLTTELYRNQLLSFAMTTVMIIVLIKMLQY